MAREIPMGLSFSRAAMDARWRARQRGEDEPALDVRITWGEGSGEDDRRFADWLLKDYAGMAPTKEAAS